MKSVEHQITPTHFQHISINLYKCPQCVSSLEQVDLVNKMIDGCAELVKMEQDMEAGKSVGTPTNREILGDTREQLALFLVLLDGFLRPPLFR